MNDETVVDRPGDRADLLTALLADLRGNGHSPHGGSNLPAIAPDHLLPCAHAGEAVALPPPPPPIADLETTLNARTAVREYDRQEVSLAEVGALLAAARSMDAAAWAEECAGGVNLELLCAVRAVTGLTPGLYGYDPDLHALRMLADLPRTNPTSGLVLQREFAAAPVILTVTGPLGAALTRHGSHGHRLLLVRAGAAAQAAWLAGLGVGLVGSPFAGLLPHALRELAGVDGYLRAPLFALAMGHPVTTVDGEHH